MSITEEGNGGVRALLCGIHDVVTYWEKECFVVSKGNKPEINVGKIWNLALFFVSLHHGTEDQQRARSGRPLTAIKKHHQTESHQKHHHAIANNHHNSSFACTNYLIMGVTS